GVALPSTKALVLHFKCRLGVSNRFVAGPVAISTKLVRSGKRRSCTGGHGCGRSGGGQKTAPAHSNRFFLGRSCLGSCLILCSFHIASSSKLNFRLTF